MLANTYQFVNEPSGRRKILIGLLPVVNSALSGSFVGGITNKKKAGRQPRDYLPFPYFIMVSEMRSLIRRSMRGRYAMLVERRFQHVGDLVGAAAFDLEALQHPH